MIKMMVMIVMIMVRMIVIKPCHQPPCRRPHPPLSPAVILLFESTVTFVFSPIRLSLYVAVWQLFSLAACQLVSLSSWQLFSFSACHCLRNPFNRNAPVPIMLFNYALCPCNASAPQSCNASAMKIYLHQIYI